MPAAQPHEAGGEPDDEGEAPDESVAADLEPPRSLRWRAAGVGAAVGALLATSVTLVVVAASTPEPDPIVASALSVFERDPLPIDDPDNLTIALTELFRDAEGTLLDDLDDVTLRWVGMALESDVYAVRWNQGEAIAICLIVDSPTQGAQVGCTPEPEFIKEGLRMGAFGVELKWGPVDSGVWVRTFR